MSSYTLSVHSAPNGNVPVAQKTPTVPEQTSSAQQVGQSVLKTDGDSKVQAELKQQIGDHVIVLVRHGETDDNKLDKVSGRKSTVSLNDTGKEQAKRLSRTLEFQELVSKSHRFYASSLERAQLTAKLALGELAKIEVLPELDEIDWGTLEGAQLPKDKSKWDKEVYRFHEFTEDYNPHGGESYKQVFERMHKAVLKMGETGNAIGFSSGRAMRIFLERVQVQKERIPPINNCDRIVVLVREGRVVKILGHYPLPKEDGR